uniref:Uncharacterized protein n=1 Tax=Anguilla anguilla TaxID=7936 RepID=A0A0E9SP07_ANGAN
MEQLSRILWMMLQRRSCWRSTAMQRISAS